MHWPSGQWDFEPTGSGVTAASSTMRRTALFATVMGAFRRRCRKWRLRIQRAQRGRAGAASGRRAGARPLRLWRDGRGCVAGPRGLAAEKSTDDGRCFLNSRPLCADERRCPERCLRFSFLRNARGRLAACLQAGPCGSHKAVALLCLTIFPSFHVHR